MHMRLISALCARRLFPTPHSSLLHRYRGVCFVCSAMLHGLMDMAQLSHVDKSKLVQPRVNWRVSVNFSAQVFINFRTAKLFLIFVGEGFVTHIANRTHHTTLLRIKWNYILDENNIFHFCGIVSHKRNFLMSCIQLVVFLSCAGQILTQSTKETLMLSTTTKKLAAKIWFAIVRIQITTPPIFSPIFYARNFSLACAALCRAIIFVLIAWNAAIIQVSSELRISRNLNHESYPR